MEKPVPPSPMATQAEWFNYSQQNAAYSKWAKENPEEAAKAMEAEKLAAEYKTATKTAAPPPPPSSPAKTAPNPPQAPETPPPPPPNAPEAPAASGTVATEGKAE